MQRSSACAVTEVLDQLKEENRELRRRLRLVVQVGGTALLGLTVLVIGGAGHNNVVEAERFELKGADGKVRAVLGVDPNGSTLQTFFGANGKRLLTLGVDPQRGESGLTLFDRDDKVRLDLAFQPLTGESGLSLFGRRGGPPLCEVKVAPDESTYLSCSDSKKVERARLTFDNVMNEASLLFWNGRGELTFKAPVPR